MQSYILTNYNSASPDGVPSQFTYALTGNSGWGSVTGPFTKFDKSDVDFMRNTTANTASMISTNAGRIGSVAAAAASVPSPSIPVFDMIAFGATVTGLGADAVAQLAKPNVGQYLESGTTGIVAGAISGRYPGLTPAVNEAANQFNDGSWAKVIQGFTNFEWNRFVNGGGNK